MAGKWYLHVTERGRQAVACAYPFWQQAQTAVAATLGRERLDELRALLSHLEEIDA